MDPVTSYRSSIRCISSLSVFALVTWIFLTPAFASGPLEHILYSFTGTPDGAIPFAGLVADTAGNLYGTTFSGGTFQCCGAVFKLSPPTTPGGAWTESVIHSFDASTDGANPQGTLIIDQQGNLFGTTGINGPTVGAVFELSPPANPGGAWTETVLYRFPADRRRGADPTGKLVMDGLGDLFGTIQEGVPSPACGSVFELRPPSITGSGWRELEVYNFRNTLNGDGCHVTNNLVMRQGALYGTTSDGGAFNKGTVFEVKKVNGIWQETVLYSFSGSDGADPEAGVVFDSVGNLYGTTFGGGSGTCGDSGCGVVFELLPPSVAGDPWIETTLYSFTGGKDGSGSSASLVLDKTGNLYGTAQNGGLSNHLTSNNGTVFELSPPAVSGGAWTETTLHDFGGQSYGDGSHPYGELFVFQGKFYGTTSLGSDVFSLTIVP